jgi:hypothetical protein
MTLDQARNLLGGYATHSLTPAEREALFAAALEHQEIFDELMREQPLAELLADPAVRDELDPLLQPALITPPTPAARQLPAPWPGRPWFALAAASAAIALFATVFYLSQRPQPTPVATRSAPAPAAQPPMAPPADPPAPKTPGPMTPSPAAKASKMSTARNETSAPDPAPPPGGVVGGIVSGIPGSAAPPEPPRQERAVAETSADLYVAAPSANAAKSAPAYRNTLATPLLTLTAQDAESGQPFDLSLPLPAGRSITFTLVANQSLSVAFTPNSIPTSTLTAIAGPTPSTATLRLEPSATTLVIALRRLPAPSPDPLRPLPSRFPPLTLTIPTGDQATYEVRILRAP